MNQISKNTFNSNEELFEFLVTTYATDIKKIIYLYIKNQFATEDILQETFISCYKNLDHFRNDSSYKTWLMKIAINKARDYLRKPKIKWAHSFHYENIPDRKNPESLTVQKFENEQLLLQVMKLPLRYREVIILFYYEKYSLEEISNILLIKQDTVKTRLFRGRKRLYKQIGGGDRE